MCKYIRLCFRFPTEQKSEFKVCHDSYILSGVSCHLMFLLLLCLAGFAPLSPSSSDLSLLVGVCQFLQQLYNRRDFKKNNYHTLIYFFYCKHRFDQQGASESHFQSDHEVVFMSSADGFCYLLTQDDSG